MATTDFDRFWQAYPKGRKLDKKAANKAWQKIGVGVEEVLSGLEKWKKVWRDLNYIPYPSTFLNKRRWEDAPEPDDYEALLRESLNRAHQSLGRSLRPKARR